MCVPSRIWTGLTTYFSFYITSFIPNATLCNLRSIAAFSNFFFCSQIPLGFQNITTDPHIFAHVNKECPDDRHPRLKICISEMILDSYEYTPVAQVTMQCMVKVKLTLEEATKAKRRSRGIVILFL